MREFSFRKRLFFSYAAVMTAVVCIFVFLMLFQNIRSNRETELLHQTQIFNQNFSMFERYPDNTSQLALRVARNSSLINYFVPLLRDPDSANYFSGNLIDSINAGSLLSDIIGVNSRIMRISVYNSSGDYISTGSLYETPSYVEALLQDKTRIDAILSEIDDSPDYCLVKGISPDIWSDNPNMQFITFYRKLAFTDTSTAYGLVEIQTDAADQADLGFWDSGEYFLVSNEGESAHIIYPQSAQLEPKILSFMNELSLDQRSGVFEIGNSLLLTEQARFADWMFVRLLPQSALTAPYLKTYYLMAAIGLLLLILLLITVNQMAVNITKPLQSLVSSIESVRLNEMDPADYNTHDYSSIELRKIDAAFRAMLERLNLSISAEMNGYMRALQSQMNPHFLYNMLTVIIESCESSGAKSAAHMCLQLTYMLRYISAPENELVTFADELEHTRNYLDLMKDRYEDHFEYQIEADESAQTRKVPRLIVQPLAENCFKHAFQGKLPPYHIFISVSTTPQGHWHLSVRDNGIGMDPEKIAEIRQQVSDAAKDVAGNYASLKIGGMALVNSLLRLTLSADDFSYRIEKNQPCGTRIEVEGN